jgi:hypothetical protein
MSHATAVRFRIRAASVAFVVLSPILSQWLGSLAWHRKIDRLYAWAAAVEAAPPDTTVALPDRPDSIAFRTAAPPPGDADVLMLDFRPNAFMWLSRFLPESSWDSVLITVRHKDGRLVPKVHYGSD